MIVDYANAYKQGVPIEITPENSKFLNSLQVTFAEQYVFCEENRFGLVREMIKANSTYRTGLRPKMD